MNLLVKKEIRLLLPGCILAVLLALVQAITRPYDFYIAALLFAGLAIMALTPIGRETSLGTFSSLLAQPAERRRIWRTKTSILAVAFLLVFVVWLAAFGIAWLNSPLEASDRNASFHLFVTVCLIAAATFAGGLWTTLLVRQLAASFWLTLLVPAVLSGVSGIFLGPGRSNTTVSVVLCSVLAVYSLGGFLFARWLFYRTQDVGWSGGVISLPAWNFFAARAENAVSARNRKPILALFEKEFQLQQVSLVGAAGLLVLHLGVIILRKLCHFAPESAGEILTAIFWMIWLVFAPVVGSMAVAEERRLGVMEGQLCLPVTRRRQFAVKAFVALFLGTFLGGVMPMLLERIALGFGARNPVFTPEVHTGQFGVLLFQLGIVASAAWLTLIGFFASTLSKSFLQAVGLGVATFVVSTLWVPELITNRMFFFGSISTNSILPLLITVPTLVLTLLWLGWLNFKNFRPGWPLWRRNLLGIVTAVVFVNLASPALYNRAWEVFSPAEPAHGPASFSLANPPVIRGEAFDNLLVQLPDGRVWFDSLQNDDSGLDSSITLRRVKWAWRTLTDPLPKIAGAPLFVAGSNWVSLSARHVEYVLQGKDANPHGDNYAAGYLDTVGVQADGTLWISAISTNGAWTGDTMSRFGEGTEWRQIVRSRAGVVLLKNDGTLWRWGTNHFDWRNWRQNWPTLHDYRPYQIGTNSDWKEIGKLVDYWNNLARKADGQVWQVSMNDKNGKDELLRKPDLDEVSFKTLSVANSGMAYVRPDGTLWVRWQYQDHGTNVDSGFVRAGMGTYWKAVSFTWSRMITLKSDGTLWHWGLNHLDLIGAVQKPPSRLGIHDDWVAIAGTWQDVIALATDGSLWLWPDRGRYEESTLLKLPKQPQRLGDILSDAP